MAVLIVFAALEQTDDEHCPEKTNAKLGTLRFLAMERYPSDKQELSVQCQGFR
jgi:tRNA U34 5-methylaminomethyl-2-thiouridine-forming methyltransferase MnmC